jgi:hypothetical protein
VAAASEAQTAFTARPVIPKWITDLPNRMISQSNPTHYSDRSVNIALNVRADRNFFRGFPLLCPTSRWYRICRLIAGKPFMERLIRIVVVAIVLGAMAVASHLVPLVTFE